MTEFIVDITPALVTISKQPIETRSYPFCFIKVLEKGESISLVAVEPITGEIPNEVEFSGSMVDLIISGGAHDDLVDLRIVVTGSTGSMCAQCVRLTVYDPLAAVLGAVTGDGGSILTYDDGSTVTYG